MARGRNGNRQASSKSRSTFTGTSAPRPPSLSSSQSMDEHLAAIDHHWTSLTPKSKAFLLEHKCLKTLTWEALMEFWTLPDQIYHAQMSVSVGTCHLLALEYYHIKAYANAAILALNGAFFQQCIVSAFILHRYLYNLIFRCTFLCSIIHMCSNMPE